MKLVALTNVRTRIKVALKGENVRPWHEVTNAFLDSEYRGVRERQMQELELEDDLLTKVPIRSVERSRWVLPVAQRYQESARDSLQRIVRICAATANAVPLAGRMVSQWRP